MSIPTRIVPVPTAGDGDVADDGAAAEAAGDPAALGDGDAGVPPHAARITARIPELNALGRLLGVARAVPAARGDLRSVMIPPPVPASAWAGIRAPSSEFFALRN
jgi:hypothetical protein